MKECTYAEGHEGRYQTELKSNDQLGYFIINDIVGDNIIGTVSLTRAAMQWLVTTGAKILSEA